VLDLKLREGGVVALAGRLDASESDRALVELNRLPGPLTLDCTELDYISSAGISVIVQTYKRLSSQGQVLAFTGMAPRVKNVFVYAGLAKLLGIQ
jgi:anti-anti-sigma factor